MNVILGSQSKLKIDLTEKVFSQFISHEDFVIVGKDVPSGVAEAPWNEETYKGALARAKACQRDTDAEYFVGLESGLAERSGLIFEEAWAVVITRDGREFVGYSSGLLVPNYIVQLMHEKNMKHNEVMKLLDKETSTHSKDTWHVYSGGKVSRDLSLKESLRNALVQISELEESLYSRAYETVD